MSEVQENALLLSQSEDTVASLKLDANGEPIMSKSKARSLRRKRAKERKKAEEGQEVNKAESQDKENNVASSTQEIVASSTQESQVAKKKSKKKKKKTKIVEQPKKDIIDNNSKERSISAATPKDISNGKTRVEKLNNESKKIPSSAAAPKDIPNGKTRVENFTDTDPRVVPNVKNEIQKPKSENFNKTEITNSEKQCSPDRQETAAQVVEESVAIPLSARGVGSREPNFVPTSVYEDDNECKEGTKDDCACACLIS